MVLLRFSRFQKSTLERRERRLLRAELEVSAPAGASARQALLYKMRRNARAACREGVRGPRRSFSRVRPGAAFRSERAVEPAVHVPQVSHQARLEGRASALGDLLQGEQFVEARFDL